MLKPIISKKRGLPLIILASIIILLFAAMVWFRMLYSRPTIVFERMLNTMLSTPSLTKQTAGNSDQGDSTQTIQIMTVSPQVIHSVESLHQSSPPDDSAHIENTLITENIGTPSADFMRYVNIKTNQKTANGKDFNFSGVTGIWGKTATDDPNGGKAQLFNKTVLGIVPVGNLSANQRQRLIEQVKKESVYEVDYNHVERHIVANRPVYTYDVTMHPAAYIAMLKTYAQDIGITELDQIDPSRYKNLPPLKFTFDIDVWSGQLTKITYTDSKQVEVYKSYGARTNAVPPTTYISASELETRLQKTQE